MRALCEVRVSARQLLRWMAGLCAVAMLATSAHAATDNKNPCSLLTAAEVEAVLGEPLAGPPFRAGGTEPNAQGESCRYETASFRAITVNVDWTDGGQMFGMINMVSGIVDAGGLKNVLTLSDGTELRGAWDEARMFMCCEFNALIGETRVMIDIGSSRATVEQAAGLADKAVQRLDQPLDVADDNGVAEATAHAATRPAIGPACNLISKAEAEELVGAPLFADPEGAEGWCKYAWTPAGADYQEEISMNVTWRDGFGEMRRTMSAIGMGLSMLSAEGLATDQTSGTDTAAFDEFSTSIVGVMAVRKDVMLSIESGPLSDMAVKFVTAAAAKF